jgi:hypothetical protein
MSVDNSGGEPRGDELTEEAEADLAAEQDIDAVELFLGLNQILATQYAPAITELYDRYDTLSSVLATVIEIVSDNAENPHSMAEELRSLLTVPEAEEAE